MCWLSGCVDDTTRYGSKDERMGSRYAAFTLLITSLCFALMGGVSGGVYYSFPFSLSVSDIFSRCKDIISSREPGRLHAYQGTALLSWGGRAATLLPSERRRYGARSIYTRTGNGNRLVWIESLGYFFLGRILFEMDVHFFFSSWIDYLPFS